MAFTFLVRCLWRGSTVSGCDPCNSNTYRVGLLPAISQVQHRFPILLASVSTARTPRPHRSSLRRSAILPPPQGKQGFVWRLRGFPRYSREVVIVIIMSGGENRRQTAINFSQCISGIHRSQGFLNLSLDIHYMPICKSQPKQFRGLLANCSLGHKNLTEQHF